MQIRSTDPVMEQVSVGMGITPFLVDATATVWQYGYAGTLLVCPAQGPLRGRERLEWNWTGTGSGQEPCPLARSHGWMVTLCLLLGGQLGAHKQGNGREENFLKSLVCEQRFALVAPPNLYVTQVKRALLLFSSWSLQQVLLA